MAGQGKAGLRTCGRVGAAVVAALVALASIPADADDAPRAFEDPVALLIGAVFDGFRHIAPVPPQAVAPATETRRALVDFARPGDRALWLGHSSFLLRFGGRTLLLDPVAIPRVTHIGVLGPSRMVPVPVAPQDLPRIDAILISHADRDHLDLDYLAAVARHSPGAVVVVPKGVGPLAARSGLTRIVERDAWQSVRIGPLAVTAIPVAHASRRQIFVPDHGYGWSGYSIAAGGRRLLFAGDTDAAPGFAEARRRIGWHRIALVPIGAYRPRWLERGYHAEPETAVAIARAVGARRAVAMHFATYALSPEPYAEQVGRFRAAARRAGIEAVVPRVGGGIDLTDR
jgi:L-ascorbate metabolism protein UlaG (beta-lactamase superfamily)